MLKYFSSGENKQEGVKFSIFDFLFRLKKLEKIAAKENVDGILLIN